MKSYTSEVSPDRKGIITSGLKAVSGNRQNVLKPIDFVATLLEGRVKYQKLPSGNSDYIEFYDKNGEMVATYSNNGWTMYTTNAEASRQTEMCMIYNEAWECDPGSVKQYFNKSHHTKKTNKVQTIKGNQAGTLHVWFPCSISVWGGGGQWKR